MDIKEFYRKHEYLYHLTSRENLEIITRTAIIFSTTDLVNRSLLSDGEKKAVLTKRRPEHVYVDVDKCKIMIRDQRPISIKALNKCLTDGWNSEQFIKHLNDRVFFWPSIKRLDIHFNRYKDEKPSIIRVSTFEMLERNPNVKFCRLNSGATRCSPYYNGAPPPRGPKTFLKANDFPHKPSDVVEVTFEALCYLPNKVWIGNNPYGGWREVEIRDK